MLVVGRRMLDVGFRIDCILSNHILPCEKVTLSDCLVLISKFYTVSVPLQNLKTILNKRAFSSKHVSIFYRENLTSFLNYVTATLRALCA